eukprot:4603868-Amphidinium_carterae.1
MQRATNIFGVLLFCDAIELKDGREGAVGIFDCPSPVTNCEVVGDDVLGKMDSQCKSSPPTAAQLLTHLFLSR